jgi:hypothetical protein
MDRRHGSTFRIHQQHGQAIRGPHRQQDASLIGQQRIARGSRHTSLFRHSIPAEAVLEFAGGSTKHLIDTGGMDLPERSQREVFHAELLEEKCPIFPHPRARLALCESEVQPRRRTAAHTTPAGTEGVDQPGITADKRVLNPRQPATPNGL